MWSNLSSRIGRTDLISGEACSSKQRRADKSPFRTGQALFSLGNIQVAQAQELLSKSNVCENDEERDALSFAAENRFEEARKSHQQSWVLYHDVLGRNHHKTADAHHKVGWHHHRRREYQPALYVNRIAP